MADLDDFLDRYQPPVEEVAVCGRSSLIADHARTESEIVGFRAKNGLAGPPAELLDRLAELEAEIERSVLVFRLQAMPYRRWADLLASHPPTKEQRASGAGANAESFEPAAFAACAVEPKVSPEQAARLHDTLPPGEWRALMDAVYRLHREQVAAPKSLLLSALPLLNDGFSTTPPDEGSLGEPSSGDSGEQ